MQQISLIHPIYLDVPMLVSFAAAIQGGLSFGAELTHEKAVAQTDGTRVAGEIGVSKLLSSLSQVSVKAQGTELEETKDTETRKESKAHTESSIAIILYDQLHRSSGYLTQPTTLDDFLSLAPGTLAELHGTLFKNPVDAVIDYIDAVSIMSGFTEKAQEPQYKHKPGKHGTGPGTEPVLKNIREALDRDRQRTPISNVQLKCSQPKGMNAVITLRTHNLRDLTLSELHKNSVRVVGKVTRTVAHGQTMSAFENYGMAMIQPEQLRQLLPGSPRTST